MVANQALKRGTLTQGLTRLARRLTGVRSVWFRAAYRSVSLRSLTPVIVEGGPGDSGDVVRWAAAVRVGPLTAPALVAPPPSRVTYRFTVPPGAAFRSHIGLAGDGAGDPPGGVDFSVSISARRSGRSIARRWRTGAGHRGSHRSSRRCRLGLAAFAGHEVELTLATSTADGASAPEARAVWVEPAIVARKPAREIWHFGVAYVRLRGFRGVLRRAIGLRGPAGRPLPAGDGAAGVTIPESPTGSPRPALEQAWRDQLARFLSDPSSALVFPVAPEPVVSIVIPTFNHAEYLYQCLASVLAHTDVPFEVIVVDDCSGDDTPALLARLENVTCVRNEQNLEFIRTCNRGIRLARGRYLLLLNNDVTVTPRWLSLLLETMEGYPRCGAVQGKLVRPEGTLQEAGTIVWRDGSALGYGRDDDPLKPEYGYLREVDYCSAACLLVRADLVHRLGGFDERYLPAYYEDVDLCFGIRRLGYKVLFQPKVTVLHYEFGSRSYQRAVTLCEANRPRFVSKWALELQDQCEYRDVLRGRDRRAGPRVLVIDDQIPSPSLGSGFPRAYRMLQLLAEAGFLITFVPLTRQVPHQPATERLQQLGIEVFHGDRFRLEELLGERAGHYDAVLVSRPHNAARMFPLVSRYFPGARLVYDAEALFCVREFLKAELDGRRLTPAARRTMLRRELDVMKHADVVITVSELERDVILRESSHPHVTVWGHAVDVREPRTPFARRKDLLFVGGFLQGHPPNTDAVRHFSSALLPRIRDRLPGCRLVIVGADPPASVAGLASDGIIIAGHVEDLTAHYEASRVFVVPLRFGAGISLKLLEAMANGLPVVTSELGARGLDLRDGRHVLIAHGDDEFVDRVVRLYEDDELWATLQRAGLEYIARHCSSDVMRGKLAETLAGVGTPASRG